MNIKKVAKCKGYLMQQNINQIHEILQRKPDKIKHFILDKQNNSENYCYNALNEHL